MALPDLLKNKLRLPVFGSPMFIISNPNLVVAQCCSGIIGSFPALNARTVEELDQWLTQLAEVLDSYNQANSDSPAAPFAVNQIVHKSNVRLEQDVELCVKHKVPVVITSLGARPEVNEAIHSYGGIVLHDVINNSFAKKAVEKGADGLIAVASGAGGHAGRLSPFALIQEIREWFDGPLLLSGSIATGDAILATQAMGADLAYIGSPFIATQEANAVEAYKQMIVDCGGDDIVYSNVFTGVHGNYLKPSIINAGWDPEKLTEENASPMDFSKMNTQGAKVWKDIWGCGQGIGAVKQVQTTKDYIAQLSEEYQIALQRISSINQ